MIGLASLAGAEVGSLNDELACWPGQGDLILDRFRYGAITGGPVDAAGRIDWLGRQDSMRWGFDFWPQPYEQCAKVLREMGHGEDARAILIEKERLQRVARRRRVDGRWTRAGLAIWDAVLAGTVRYGHRPLLAFAWLGLFFLAGWSIFQSAADDFALKPNNAVMLRQDEWAECAPGRALNAEFARSQLACFLAQPAAAGYPEFSAFIYSADTLLPVVSLEMQEYWIPDENNGGAWMRRYLWVHIVAGWFFSLLAVAGFSGLVKSD